MSNNPSEKTEMENKIEKLLSYTLEKKTLDKKVDRLNDDVKKHM